MVKKASLDCVQSSLQQLISARPQVGGEVEDLSI